MNKSEILALKPGREMDALVLETLFHIKTFERLPHDVFGFDFATEPILCRVDEDGETVKAPRCSDDWRAAGAVLDWLVNHGDCPALLFDDNGHWAVAMDGSQNVPMGDDPEDISTCFFVEKELWCDTAPEAICRAALLSVASEDNTLSE